MNSSRILGIAVLALGIALLIMGMNASHSLADQVSNTFTGHFTDKTTWFILGGAVLAILGVGTAVFGPGGKNA